MTTHCLLVTGPPGSGKTEFADRIARIAGLAVVNVGDLLLEWLIHNGAANTPRRRIGAEFLSRASVEEYLRIVHNAAGPGVLLDGLRLYSAVEFVRARMTTVHIHRQYPPAARARLDSGAEGFEDDLPLMARSADFIVEWVEPLSELDAVARALLREFHTAIQRRARDEANSH